MLIGTVNRTRSKYVSIGRGSMIAKNPSVARRSEAGYTLFEMFIALSVFLTMVMLIPTAVDVFKSTDTKLYDEQELTLFFEQAEKEIQGSITAETKPDLLYLVQPDGSTISYEKYGSRLVRKVDGEGFEMLVQNIRGFSADATNYSVKLTLTVHGKTFTHSAVMVQPASNRANRR
jgi:competence protein ComGF